MTEGCQSLILLTGVTMSSAFLIIHPGTYTVCCFGYHYRRDESQRLHPSTGLIPGKRNERTMTEKFIKININGRTRPFLTKAKEITYQNVVEYAFGSYEEHPNRIFTVTYSKGGNHKSGTLMKGEAILVIEGMVFNATVTDKS